MCVCVGCGCVCVCVCVGGVWVCVCVGVCVCVCVVWIKHSLALGWMTVVFRSYCTCNCVKGFTAISL